MVIGIELERATTVLVAKDTEHKSTASVEKAVMLGLTQLAGLSDASRRGRACVPVPHPHTQLSFRLALFSSRPSPRGCESGLLFCRPAIPKEGYPFFCHVSQRFPSGLRLCVSRTSGSLWGQLGLPQWGGWLLASGEWRPACCWPLLQCTGLPPQRPRVSLM